MRVWEKSENADSWSQYENEVNRNDKVKKMCSRHNEAALYRYEKESNIQKSVFTPF